MLKILNTLGPFFEDCYRWFSVREYARITGISPPTSSKYLKDYAARGYLQQRSERVHLLFALNNANEEIVDLCRLYWKHRLKDLAKLLSKKTISASAILFGSTAKAEAHPDSDVDIAVFAPEKKTIDMAPFVKKLKREISIHWFTSLHEIKNEHLRNNILTGVILFGKVKW